LALFGPHAMFELSPLCEQQQTSLPASIIGSSPAVESFF
jgi:hypothetical protein